MKVRLREMPAERHLELAPAFIREAVAGLPLRAALERPEDDPEPGKLRADLDLYTESGNVFVRGRLAGWIEVACSRCVEAASVKVDEELAVTYMPAAQARALEAEAEAAAEEDDDAVVEGEDVYPMADDEVDLAPMLREQVILAVPFAPLCREACEGLCPRCGKNRNLEPCPCPTEVPDPRLAALGNIKLGDDGQA